MPGARLAPAASFANWKKQTSVVTTGEATIRHSLRDGFFGCSVLSPVSRAFLPPSPAGSSPANLTPASGCQDHTA